MRWAWDLPPPNATIRGEKLVVEGWLADWPEDGEVVIESVGRILARSRARLPRPGVARALSLDDDHVGFHIEADLCSVATNGRVSVTLAVMPVRGQPRRLIGGRTF